VLEVAPPYEIYEPERGHPAELTVLDWGQGPVQITPRDGRGAKTVMAVRVAVPATEKATAPQYWDLTSQTLRPTLVGLLQPPGALPRRIRLTKSGTGAQARYSIQDLGKVQG